MANVREELVNRFIAFNGEGKVQAAVGTAMANGDLDTRDKCTITREEVVTRRDRRDCRNEDLVDSKVVTRAARYTLVYAETTPQLYARWAALFFGGSAAPTGSPANETQTVTVSGSGTLSLTVEGRTVTTKTLSGAATAAEIQAALTASRMRFLQPGDVVVSGTGPFTVSFQGRWAKANVPLLVGTGGYAVTAGSNGAQNYHVLSRSVSRTKKRFSFALGYEDDTATIEKYADYVCESFQPGFTLDGDPALTVTIVGPWDYDSLEPGLSIPECVNPDTLLSEDCTIEIDGVFQTADINSVTNTLNDNIPLDRLSAFSFDGIDVQNLIRGRQPTYTAAASIFGMSAAAIYALAQNERTQAPVVVREHYGLPGNRFTLIYPEAKIRFQNNREQFVGAAEYSTVNLDILPLKDGANPPVSAEAYIDQAAQFLLT